MCVCVCDRRGQDAMTAVANQHQQIILLHTVAERYTADSPAANAKGGVATGLLGCI